MTIPAPGPGPQCEPCQAEPAIISLMQLSDWSQLRIGANCAPEVLRSIADTMDGRTTALPAADPELDECPLCGAMVPLSQMEAHQAAEHPDGAGAAVELTEEQRQAVLAMMPPEDVDAILNVPARAEGMEIQLPSGQVVTWAEWLALGGRHDPGSSAPGDASAGHWSGAGKVVRSTHGHRKPRGARPNDRPASGDQEGAPGE